MSKLSLREKAAQFRIKKENKINYFLTNLQNIKACMLSNGSAMYFIISPSNYKQNHYQLTTFIRNIPHSHSTHESIEALINNSIIEIINYDIMEVIS